MFEFDLHCVGGDVKPCSIKIKDWRRTEGGILVVFERLHYLQAREAISDVHGLDSSMDWIGLGPMTVMYKIMTACFQRNRPRLFYVIISDFCLFYFSLLSLD